MQTIPFDIFTALASSRFSHYFGVGSKKPDFKLRLHQRPVPLKGIDVIASCMTVVSGIPDINEYWRCYRARQRGVAGNNIPESAQEDSMPAREPGCFT
jgi:hypothetical protein